ncbi:hypothetical protein P7K49_030166 [Saguinus oedipus]|uniref:Uncharacterized protein n=1 Tax=Saguinus oedipus TaxID=9490 RepID=A0ABQ9U1G9_SAGOE|nr:hypothetical protein P7K49_030166 [Saguinus oedipus]
MLAKTAMLVHVLLSECFSNEVSDITNRTMSVLTVVLLGAAEQQLLSLWQLLRSQRSPGIEGSLQPEKKTRRQ